MGNGYLTRDVNILGVLDYIDRTLHRSKGFGVFLKEDNKLIYKAEKIKLKPIGSENFIIVTMSNAEVLFTGNRLSAIDVGEANWVGAELGTNGIIPSNEFHLIKLFNGDRDRVLALINDCVAFRSMELSKDKDVWFRCKYNDVENPIIPVYLKECNYLEDVIVKFMDRSITRDDIAIVAELRNIEHRIYNETYRDNAIKAVEGTPILNWLSIAMHRIVDEIDRYLLDIPDSLWVFDVNDTESKLVYCGVVSELRYHGICASKEIG